MRYLRTTAHAMTVALALALLVTAARAKDKSPANMNKSSGGFVSFVKGVLTLDVGGTSQTFTVPERVPVKIGKEASMSPGAFNGVPKGTKVDVTLDENQNVSQVTIAKPNYHKR
jgi:hypothetical protein